MNLIVFVSMSFTSILASKGVEILPKVQKDQPQKDLAPAVVMKFGGTALNNFYISDRKENYFIAASVCKRRVMKLAELNTLDDQLDLMGFLREKNNDNKRYWIGGNRIDGTWRWGTQGPGFFFTYWGPGQPNNKGGNERCISTLVKSMKWDDIDCDNENFYICQHA